MRWWIESYVDTRQMFDRVHTAMEHALDEAGIEMPFPTQSIRLQLEPDTADLLQQALPQALTEQSSV